MTILVSLIGILITAIGLLGFVAPATLLNQVDRVNKKAGLWVTVIIRGISGIIFIIGASQCRFPEFIQFFGVLALTAAVIIPFLGQNTVDALMVWFLKLPTPIIRIWFLVAAALGAFIIYASGWPPIE